MIQYPVSFYAHANSLSGIHSLWTTQSQDIGQSCAVPPEFEGPGGALSPEDLFAQALTNCFIATFKVYAEKSKIDFSTLAVDTHLIVDLDEKKKPVMKSCLLKVQIEGGENIERIKLLADKAFKSGFIINSVKTEMKMELDIKV